MSAHLQHTKPASPAQAQQLAEDIIFIDRRWQAEVLPLLPAEFSAQALSLRAFCRSREIKSAAMLLRALLAYALCWGSFALLGSWAVLIDLANISDRGWSKHFRTANCWLEWLLQQLLAVDPAAAATTSTAAAAEAPTAAADAAGAAAAAPAARAERVIIIDSTITVQPAGKGEDWRTHAGFDLTNRRFDTLILTDDHVSEDTAHYPLGPGDICVGDAGHGRRRLIVHTVAQQGADILVRIHPRTCPLEDEAGVAVDVTAWLRTLPKRYHARKLYCRFGKQRVPVRLVAVRLSDAATKKAQQRKRKKASMDQRQITEETLYLAGWVLLVTSLPAQSWPTDAVVRLYRARWQVELLFKQLKQLVGYGELTVRNREVAQGVLRAKLVGWALAAKQSGILDELLPRGIVRRKGVAISSWQQHKLGLMHLRAVVLSGWTAQRLEECLDDLVRYLSVRTGSRQQQERRIRDWLRRRQEAMDRMFAAADPTTTLCGA
jgi:hypothetical protein